MNEVRSIAPSTAALVRIGVEQSGTQPIGAAATVPSVPSATSGRTWLHAGQSLLARVEQRLQGNEFILGITAGAPQPTQLRAELPGTTSVGEILRFTVETTEPHLTLRLNNFPTAVISLTGQLLARLSESSAHAALVQGQAPLVANSVSIDVPELALSMRQALRESGLFYESHQVAWVQGRLNLPALQREPQARVASDGVLSAAEPAHWASASCAPVRPSAGHGVEHIADSTGTPTRREPAAGNREMSPAGVDALDTLTSSPTDGTATVSPIHPRLEQLVQAQLATLESGQFTWVGQAWPGQSVELEVHDEGSSNAEDADASRRWRTRLRLSLPALGSLSAVFTLDRHTLTLELEAADAHAKTRLQGAAPALLAALQARGLQVASMRIDHGPVPA